MNSRGKWFQHSDAGFAWQKQRVRFQVVLLAGTGWSDQDAQMVVGTGQGALQIGADFVG